jgi:uncharacterized protein YuzE
MNPCHVTWAETERTDVRVEHRGAGEGVLIDIAMAHEPMGIVIVKDRFITLPLTILRFGGYA